MNRVTAPPRASSQAAIAGAAAAPPRSLAGLTVLRAQADACLDALADSGLALRDVDAVFAHVDDTFSSLLLTEYLGLRTRVSVSTNLGGMSSLSHLSAACEAVAAGRCRVALVSYGSVQASTRMRTLGGPAVDPRSPRGQFAAPSGQLTPMGFYAMLAQLHMHRYGTRRESMAEVAVAARRWAQLNPDAAMRGPLSIEDVLALPMIAEPFTARDCCLVTDGAGALVVTSLERARDLARPPVRMLGAAESHSHQFTPLGMDDWLDSGIAENARAAMAQAGISHDDIDVTQIYDHFTIGVIHALEELGFCARGEGGDFVRDGRIAPGGAFPMNTSGGGLSYCHPGMFGMLLLVEAVRQLRGECGERQVPDARVSLCFAPGLVFSGSVVTILARD
ncbi:MAG: acetyl-CoA acetyltransferase [Burkholderiaceae bacterium]